MVEGLLLGLVYVLPPGPVTAETVRRSLHGGLPAALSVQLGAVGGDLICALAVLVSAGPVIHLSPIRTGTGICGAVLLLYLGWSTLRSAHTYGVHEPSAAGVPAWEPASLWRHARIGFVVALVNPFAVGFWITVGSSAVESARSWLAGFFLGSLLASLLTTLVAGRLHGRGVERPARWIALGCGCVLIVLGLRLWCSTLGLL